MKRMLFVYNPNSGMGLLKPKLSDVIDTFVKGGYEVTVYPTQRSQDAVRKVSEYKEEYDEKTTDLHLAVCHDIKYQSHKPFPDCQKTVTSGPQLSP